MVATPSGGGAAPAYRRQLFGSHIVVDTGALANVSELLSDHPALARARLAIVTDSTVAPLYASALAAALTAAGRERPTVLTIPPGEASKTRKHWSRLTDELLDAGYGRDCAVLALGGGVVGDLAGFVAATFMRGVPVVQLPTSLLAMIDASIGGKTGVDTRAGKNLVGAFHHPSLVVVDPAVLRTLPVQHLRAGLAEAAKHGVIASESLLSWLAANATALTRSGGPEPALAGQLVRENIEIKASVVERDERETGIRKILNFGHTIGHAIESASDFALLHGECVSIGMVAESRLAERLGITTAAVVERISATLTALGLPVARPQQLTPDALLAATRSDKKTRAGQVEYALPVTLGVMAGADRGFGTPVPDALVLEVLRSL